MLVIRSTPQPMPMVEWLMKAVTGNVLRRSTPTTDVMSADKDLFDNEKIVENEKTVQNCEE